MGTIKFESHDLAVRLRQDASRSPRIVMQAMFSAGQRGRAYILKKTPVDRGILKVAWKVIKSANSVSLVNDQPYAGVMERGARPFKMTKAGVEALAGWVKRVILSGNIQTVKHGSNTSSMPWKQARKAQLDQRKKSKAYKKQALWALDEEAMSIAYAIAKKFQKVGVKGRFFVYKSLPILSQLMTEEVERYLSKFFERSNGDKGS